MLKLAVFVIFCLIHHAAAEDAAVAMANKIHTYFTNFFTVDELVKLEKHIAKKLCAGKSFDDIHHGFTHMIMSSVGGQTAMKSMQLYEKLATDLGKNMKAVKKAINRVANANLEKTLAEAKASCKSGGVDGAIAAANNHLDEAFFHKQLQETKTAILATSPENWEIIKSDLGEAILFAKHGL